MAGHARHLPEHGWDATVLAPREGAYYRDEGTLFPEGRVIRTASIELSRLGKRALRTGGDDVRPAEVTGLRRRIRQVARNALYFPDAQAGWALPALRAGGRALKGQRFDAVFSSSFPITAHLVARRLARRAGLPWVAEFRDPWSQMLPEGARHDCAERLERALARDASAVVMTSPSWARLHGRLWERDVDVVPNGHELEARAPREAPGHLVVGYLGTYYPSTQASLTGVWDALKRIGRPASVRFIGELDPSVAGELRSRGLLDRVEVTGFLPNAEAIERLRECSVALLAGPRDASGILRGQVAGKVWEYLATDVPVLYVGDPQADVAEALRRFAGTALVGAEDADAIAAAMSELGDATPARDASRLSRRARAAELAAILERVTANYV